MAARAKLVKIDQLESIVTVVDPAESWLDKPVSEWPDGTLFPITDGVYARTMMLMGEAKVTFGSYSDGSLSKEEMVEKYWNTLRHDGDDPPNGTPTSPRRLDCGSTLNLVEMVELKKLMAMDDNKNRQDNYFLSDDTSTPYRRGRILSKNGRTFKLANASMYEAGGGAVRRFDSVSLGNDLAYLRKVTKALADRLVWLEEHRRFAGSQSARKTDEVRQYLIQRAKSESVKNVLALIDQDPAKWGTKREADWVNIAKEEYRNMDRNALILKLLTNDNISKGMSEMTLGEIRETIAKALASPQHINGVMEGLFVKGAVLFEKRKTLVEKYKRKRKAPVEASPPPPPAEVLYEEPSQDTIMFSD